MEPYERRFSGCRTGCAYSRGQRSFDCALNLSLSQTCSFHLREKTAPSKPGIKHLDALADQIITPERLVVTIREALRHRRERASQTAAKRQTLKLALKTVEAQIERLVSAVAAGTIPDMALVRGKLEQFGAERDECHRLALLDQNLPELRRGFSNQQAKSIAATLKRRLLDAPRAIQRHFVRGLVSSVVVNKETIVISGSKVALAARASKPDSLASVPGYVPKWCALGESNPSCRNENPES
jgi:hypothetical protein